MADILSVDPAELLLVDINLEGKDGLTITREQRSISKVGIILLTARDDQVDKVVGLEMGLMTISSSLSTNENWPQGSRTFWRALPISGRPRKVRHPSRHSAHGDLTASGAGWFFVARTETLTKQEFDVMSALAVHPGQTLSLARLADMMGRKAMCSSDPMIDVVVGRLRKKLEHDPANPEWILTKHGRGYHFVDPKSV